jgi:C1A family cysteine protease
MIKTVHHADGSTRRVHLGGWKKQSVDLRDEEYRLKIHGSFLAIPSSYDLRPICSPIEDQGDLGSCTANMFAGMVESNEVKAGRTVKLAAAAPSVTTGNVAVSASGVITFTTTVTPGAAPSPAPTPAPTPAPAPTKLIKVGRLFEYYATRKIEGSVSEDSGASIRDTIKAGYTYGVTDEAAWPYDTAKFAVNPPAALWTAAASHKVTSYHSIADGDIQTMKSAIASGYLVGYGFNVYSYFMSQDMASKGFLPLPGPTEQNEGGHAQCLCGYDDNKVNPFDPTKKGAFLVRNSWGTGWGLAGYYWVAYDYISNKQLASDFWVIQSSPI